MTIKCMYDLQHYVDVVAQYMVYRCIRCIGVRQQVKDDVALTIKSIEMEATSAEQATLMLR